MCSIKYCISRANLALYTNWLSIFSNIPCFPYSDIEVKSHPSVSKQHEFLKILMCSIKFCMSRANLAPYTNWLAIFSNILCFPYSDIEVKSHPSVKVDILSERLGLQCGCIGRYLNTLTSMQDFYRIFGSISAGRLPGTIKSTFKAIRYCLKG